MRNIGKLFLIVIAIIVVFALLGAGSPAQAATTQPQSQIFQVTGGEVQVHTTAAPGTQIRYVVERRTFGRVQSVNYTGFLNQRLLLNQGQYKICVQNRPAGSSWRTPFVTHHCDYEQVWTSGDRTSAIRWGTVRY